MMPPSKNRLRQLKRNHQQENTEEAEEIIESALIEENQEVTSVTEHEVSE